MTPAAQQSRVTAGRTLIRRYVLALPPAGAGNEAAVTATSVPQLSGGPDSHGSAAAHALTIADSVGGVYFVVTARRVNPEPGSKAF